MEKKELLKSDENFTIYKSNNKIIIYNLQSGVEHTIDLKDDEYYSES